MTVISSASGTRIDCDACGEHAATPAWSAPALRLEAGFVRHEGRDWCPGCWSERGAREPGDEGPAAA